MKTLLFLFLIFSLTVQGQKKYKISRYEETPTSLFICINSDKSYVEHVFTSAEMATASARKATIEKLVAELELKDEAFVAPLTVTYKEKAANLLVLDTANIRVQKAKLRLAQKLQVDSSKPIQ